MVTNSVYLVDDDAHTLSLAEVLLSDAGYRVTANTSSTQGFAEILQQVPDIVILDIMMPEMDGLEICKELRQRREFDNTIIIMFTAKTFEFDRRRAYKMGANGYLVKPINMSTFVDSIRAIAADQITLTFWGVRGTLPVPGQQSIRYGGNTVCVTMALPAERFFIFDAGTGIKNLSNHLVANERTKLSAKIFISHPHWDHINALPFFAPLYISGNEFEICGPAQGDLTMKELISAQMDDVYFPITMKEFAAYVHFNDLREGSYQIDGVEIKTMLLNHPGYCLGYRINYNGHSVCYITDNELLPVTSSSYYEHERERLSQFVYEADLLITDSTYFDHEYPSKQGWGHSAIGEVARFAHHAAVKRLCLYHHDPDQNDDDIDKKLSIVQEMLQSMNSDTLCIAPRENESIII